MFVAIPLDRRIREEIRGQALEIRRISEMLTECGEGLRARDLAIRLAERSVDVAEYIINVIGEPMYHYDLSLGFSSTVNGEPFVSLDGKGLTYHNLNETALAAVIAEGQSIAAAAKKAEGKGGGNIALTLTCNVNARDGGQVPQYDPTLSYSGLTLHGFSDVEAALTHAMTKLVKMGRDHAVKKEGPQKP